MKKFGNILWGIVFIAIGIIIALNALRITNINIFFNGWWTLFIIIPCFIGLFKETEKTGNIIGIIIGVMILLACQDIVDFNMIWKLIFPIILISIGISFIFKDTINNKINSEIKKINKTKKNETEYCATFAAQDIRFDGEEFKGADLTAVFGGIKCDLREAIIKEDSVMNISAIFGGIDIFIPENVNIKVKSTPIFGGVSNKKQTKIKEDANTIYINSTCLFGGVEIK